MSVIKLPLTFGVEIEFLFAVRKPNSIGSPPPDEVNLDRYEADPEDMCHDECGVINPKDEDYHLICKSGMVLRNKGVALALYIDAHEHWTLVHRWNLTTDLCIHLPSTDEQAVRWTNNIARTVDDWEFSGQELISPILKTPDTGSAALDCASFRELDSVLGAMQTPASAPYIYTANPQVSSLHVHIGLELSELGTPNDMPLKVLQHLAWIVLAFEDTMTLLHHPERHGYYGTKSREQVMSNRRIFSPAWQLKDRTLPNFCHTCSLTPVFNTKQAFGRIFGEVNSHLELASLLSNLATYYNGWWRTTIVNFANVAVHPSPSTNSHTPSKTVEFRQHHGTLDVQEIKEWVYFVTSLVRAAEKKSNEVSEMGLSGIHHSPALTVAYEKAKYPMIWAKKTRTLRELFDLMDLPLERRKYWFLRAQKMRSDNLADYWKNGTCIPGECTGLATRDSEGWEEGELIDTPWGPELEGDTSSANEDPMNISFGGGASSPRRNDDGDVQMS